ncbi:MAG TPA: TMEM175 family protein, partial [Candidatus Baltobacteraceae bacterium]|nr:TMEM175 family protein [Candidatus Baltobacteraceae bacterium]
MDRDESEERSIHRFEAFSDIVIGFSLAQLGASLALPSRPIELFTNLIWLVAFLWAFAMVCSMWWFHHRFFTQLFVPRT